MYRKFCLLLLLLLPAVFSLQAQESRLDSLLTGAATAYQEGRYDEAVVLYETVLAEFGESDRLYYNLGNACYKAGNIAPAILNYERALRLNPGDEDTRFNLEMCQAYVVDKIEPLGEFLLVRWYRSLRGCFRSNTWALVSLGFFLLLLVSAALYFLSSRRGLKKLAFTLGILSILITTLALVFSVQLRGEYIHPDQAVVFAPTVTVKSSPDKTGTDLFLLHEGTKVQLKSHLGSWTEIRLADGSVGWLESETIQII